MSQNQTADIESRTDFEETDSGQYKYWHTEMTAFDKRTKSWAKQGSAIVGKFLGGKRKDSDNHSASGKDGFRLNLFHSNVVTLQSMLYGNLPKVDVSRRYNDPNDDTGRVASLVMERLLNNDVQDNGKEYNSVLRACLQDRLLPGLGSARVRYEVETEETPTGIFDEGGVEQMDEKVVHEEAPIDYYHWRDMAWGWGRTFSELPWIAFKSYMKKDEIAGRFGDDAAEGVVLKDQSVTPDDEDGDVDPESGGPWKKAEVWEIWDKSAKKVVWYSKGYDKVLDTKEDFLELSGFFPCPPFLLANQTTSLYMPTPDYHLAQDLYNEVDTLQTRISIITEAVKVVGVYDAAAEEIGRMFDEGKDNDLIPCDKWAMFGEKGGLQGQIDWFPVGDVVAALQHLVQMRNDAIGLLQQVTGMSDVMRGQLESPYEGVGQTQAKAKFGSVRVQALQDEFANFASDLLQLKGEVISRHFEPESIAMYANLDSTFDRELVPGALELIKNPEMAKLKIKVRPESIAMVDYAEMKAERTEFITALATFMQSAGPMIEADPAAKPYLLTLLQWAMAGFKGSNEIEGVMDKAIQLSIEEEKKDKPDPEQQAQQQAAQMEKMKFEYAMKLIQAKSEADLKLRQADSQADLFKIQQELQADIEELKAKASTQMQTEQTTSQINAEQQRFATEGEMEKAMLELQNELILLKAAHEIALKELAAQPKPTTSGGDNG